MAVLVMTRGRRASRPGFPSHVLTGLVSKDERQVENESARQDPKNKKLPAHR